MLTKSAVSLLFFGQVRVCIAFDPRALDGALIRRMLEEEMKATVRGLLGAGQEVVATDLNAVQ